MSWSYDFNALSTPLNAVRLLIGDTDTTNQQMQNEEIAFFLLQYSGGLTYLDQIRTAIDCVSVMGQRLSDQIEEEETGDIRVKLFARKGQLSDLLTKLKDILRRKAAL